MKYNYKVWLMACLAALLFLRPTLSVAAPFAPGNFVVARVGDGSAALSSAATAVFLDEYTPAGVLVQTVELPTSVSGSNRILTASGNSTTELGLTRSADGRYLVITGYSAAPGTPAVAGTTSSDIARVIGRIAADGTLDTSTSTADAFSTGNIRSAATTDGLAFYAVGSNSGVRYVPFGSIANTQLNTTPTNIRYVNTFGGNLYISAASSTFYGLSQVGTGLPTTSPQTVTVLPGFPAATTGSSPYGFYFADLSTTVPGVDVVYVADDRTSASGGIQKWSLVGSTWVLNGTITGSPAPSLRGLNGMTAGTTVSLVATGGTTLFFLTDNAGYNAAPSTATLPTAIATATANTAFRGVAFAPEAPAPTLVSFTPASGAAGAVVTLTGTNFTGATALTLNGVAITGFTVVNATTITFAVPAGATSGLIAVTTQGGTATSATAFTVTVPPTITSLSPTTAVAGATGFPLTVTGTGFIASSVVNFNGVALVTTFVSATELTATVPASAISTAGTYNVTVENPAVSGGTSAASTFTVTVPAPTLVSFTPASGAAAATVTLTGTNFTGATAVTLNGVAITGFTVVNATTITFAVPAGATSGLIAVTTPGGTATSATAFTVTVPNPVPTVTSLSPTTAVAGTTGFPLTVTGTGFIASSVVNFNGVALTTTFVSATELTAAVPASAVATAGAYAVNVTNPAPGGGTSTDVTFTVTVPVPTITGFTPASGAAAATVTLTGTNFTGATALILNGVAITGFTVVNATTITFAVPAGATSGLIAVTTPGGTATSATAFTFLPAPTITAFTPASGNVGTVVTVTGTNFTGTTALTLNGVAITGFTVVNATTITFTVPAGATSGAIAVTTPDGTATSATAYTVTVPPTITSLSPTTAVAGTTGFILTVTGTGFTASAVVSFNGVALTTTFVSATELTAAVPASAISTAGTYNVTVENPAVSGGTSAASTFTVTVPAPTLVSFTPASGAAAATVTLTGTNFTGATAVTLNGVAITGFTVVNATTITFVVPAGAGSGLIAVTTPGGTATSATAFTVIVTPVITALSPSTQVAGGPAVPLTVTGTGFTPTSTISFNGVVYTPSSSTATSLQVTIPAAVLATAGTFPVTVTNAAGTSNALSFVVTVPPVPTITSFTPTTGGPGTFVTITGTNFTGATAVSIGTFAVSNFLVVSATTITFNVPAGTGSVIGFIRVVTPGGTATSATSFNLISAVLASQAMPGLLVYPNPVTDRLTVELPQAGAATVALRDLTGRVVLAPAPLAADRQLYLPASLASGVYLLEVQQGATTAIRRVEKQ